jgi:hypothetical protein
MIVHAAGMNANEDNLVIWIGEDEKIELQDDLIELLDACPNLRILLVNMTLPADKLQEFRF